MGGGRGGDRGRVGEGRRGRAQGAGGLGEFHLLSARDNDNARGETEELISTLRLTAVGTGSMAEEDVKDESNSHLPSQLGAGSTGGGASGGVGSEGT